MSANYSPQPSNDDQRSVPELIADLATEASTLVRKEVQLARAEVSENVSRMAGAVPAIAAAAALGLGALLLLLQAAAAGISRLFDLAPGWSLLIVGALAGGLALLLLRGALEKLKMSNLMPHRTAEQLSRDAQAAKEQVR